VGFMKLTPELGTSSVQFPETPSTDRNRPLLTNGDVRSSGYADPPLPGGANVGAVLRQSSATVRAAKRRLETTPFCSVLRLKFEALRTLIPGVLAVVSKPARYIQ
jgi:hypothetical protein